MAKASESEFSDLFGALGTLAAAAEGAIHLATTIDIGGLDNTGILNEVSKNAELVKKNLASIAAASEKASDVLSRLSTKDIAASSKEVANGIDSIASQGASIGQEAFDDLTRSALTGAGSPNFSVAQTISLFDSQPSGLAFGYQPAQDAVKSAINIFGKDSDVGKWLVEAQGTFEDIGAAIPFVNIAIGLITSQFATVEANNSETVRLTDAYVHRLEARRAQLRGPKEGVGKKVNSLIRIDGVSYGSYNWDARIRDRVIAGAGFYPGGIANQPVGIGFPWVWSGNKALPDLKPGTDMGENAFFGNEDVNDALIASMKWVRDHLGEEKWKMRKAAMTAFRALQTKERDLVMQNAKVGGKLYSAVDGARGFEQAKDSILMSLMRAGAIHVREVQAVAGAGDSGIFETYREAQTDNEAILYAISAPGSSLWTYWANLANRNAPLNRPKLSAFKLNPKTVAAHINPPWYRKHPAMAVAAAVGIVGLGLTVGRKFIVR